MKAIFYRSKYGSLFSKLIDRWTGGLGFSHSEIAFSEEATLWYIRWLRKSNHHSSIWNTSFKQIWAVQRKAGDLGSIEEGIAGLMLALIKVSNLRLCFSASERDKCVRLKLIDVEPKKWVSIECVATLEEEKRMIGGCESLCGQAYDYIGLLGFLSMKLHIIKPHPKKWWCSETTQNILTNWRYIGDGHYADDDAMPPSPNGLYKQLASMPKPLIRK